MVKSRRKESRRVLPKAGAGVGARRIGMKASDLPGDVKDNLKAALKRQGIDSPTDAQLMNAYWNMKVARK